MADDPQRAGRDRQQIAEQHGRVGRLAADDGGTDEAADEGEGRNEHAVAQRQADRESRQRGRHRQRGLGDHVVERHGGEQRAVERGDTGGGQRLGHAVVADADPSAPPTRAKPNSAARITRTSGER